MYKIEREDRAEDVRHHWRSRKHKFKLVDASQTSIKLILCWNWM